MFRGVIQGADNAFEISSAGKYFKLGTADGPLSGEGVFLGEVDGDNHFFVGDSEGEYLHFDGDTGTLTITGQLVSGSVVEDGVEIATGNFTAEQVNVTGDLLTFGNARVGAAIPGAFAGTQAWTFIGIDGIAHFADSESSLPPTAGVLFDGAGGIELVGSPKLNVSTSGSAGAAQGYIEVEINGTARLIPYYDTP